MVKNELFTIYDGTRTRTAVEAVDDLEEGVFSDEEALPRVQDNHVPGRMTERDRSFNNTDPFIRVRFPAGTDIEPDMRVGRESSGTIYVVSSVTKSKLAGGEIIATLRT